MLQNRNVSTGLTQLARPFRRHTVKVRRLTLTQSIREKATKEGLLMVLPLFQFNCLIRFTINTIQSILFPVNRRPNFFKCALLLPICEQQQETCRNPKHYSTGLPSPPIGWSWQRPPLGLKNIFYSRSPHFVSNIFAFPVRNDRSTKTHHKKLYSYTLLILELLEYLHLTSVLINMTSFKLLQTYVLRGLCASSI